MEEDLAAPALLARREPERLHLQPALAAVDPQEVIGLQADAGRDLGNDAVRELEDGRGPLVDAGPAEMAGAADAVRLEERFAPGRACDQPCNRGRVAADIEDGPAAEVVGEKPVRGVRISHLEADGRPDHADFAEEP